MVLSSVRDLDVSQLLDSHITFHIKVINTEWWKEYKHVIHQLHSNVLLLFLCNNLIEAAVNHGEIEWSSTFPVTLTLSKKCPYSELFWYVFSCIRTEYEEIRSTSPYPVWIRENTDQSNSEYGRFSRSVRHDIPRICE